MGPAYPAPVVIRAALFDIGGVLISSPFDAFAHYEAEAGLPPGFIRRLNATNPDANAWALLERAEIDIDEFCRRYEAEASAAGGVVDARALMASLSGERRPAMIEAVRRCRTRLKTAALTNNWLPGDDVATRTSLLPDVLALFDVVIESSQVGIRKPDPAFYRLACDRLGIEPDEAVFLDDLGRNLKAARRLGMTTIKVEDPDRAIDELEQVVGFSLR